MLALCQQMEFILPTSGSGLLTLSFGKRPYLEMAVALARSYRRFNPKRPICVATDDASANYLRPHFDDLVLIDSSLGGGVVQKLHIDKYTPYEETLFVDSDCLFFKDPDIVWECYAVQDFAMRGWRYLTGSTEFEIETGFVYTYAEDLPSLLEHAGIERFSHFNSGVFYFRTCPTSDEVFRVAREVYADRNAYGLRPFKNAPVNDEPVFSIAMEKNGVEMLDWDNVNGQETSIDMVNDPGLNILDGKGAFTKRGQAIDPAILHFNVVGQRSQVYFRERMRLAHGEGTVHALLISGLVLVRAQWLFLRRVGNWIGRKLNST